MPALYPGLWQASPGPVTIAGPVGAAFENYALTNVVVTYAIACEPTPANGGLGVATQMDTSYDVPTGITTVQQVAVDYQLQDYLPPPGGVWTPPLPWPTGATDWEFDPAVPVGSWLDGIVVTLGLDAGLGTGGTVDAVPADPAPLDVFPPGTFEGYPHARPLPGAAMTPIVGSVLVPSVGSTSLTTSVIAASYVKDLGVPIGPTSSYRPLQLVLAFDNQRTHTPPTVPLRANVTDSTVSVLHFTPPRWRFLYAKPPRLRQHPRDDYLGGAPRQGRVNQPKSIQASSRQGWAGTYR